MRAARLLLTLAASASLVGAIATGCGSSSSPANPVDSGSADVTTDVAIEAAAEAAPEAAPMEASVVDAACVPDASIQSLPVPDASIGDSGATTAACLSCFEAACSSIVAMCNMSCACISGYETFQTCVSAPGSSLLSCGTAFATAAGVNVTSLACALPCATACGYTGMMGGDSGGGGDSATMTDANGQ